MKWVCLSEQPEPPLSSSKARAAGVAMLALMIAVTLFQACYGEHGAATDGELGIDAVVDVPADEASDVPDEIPWDVPPDVDEGAVDPEASRVSTTSESEPADGLTAFDVIVAVVSSAGEPLAGVPLRLEASGAAGVVILQPPPTGMDGVTTGRVLSIDGGEVTIEAVAETDAGSVSLTDTATLSFTGCTTTADYYRRGVRGPVFSICTGCHNDYGLAIEEPWSAYPLWHIDDRLDDATVSATLATLKPLAEAQVNLPDGTTMAKLLAKPTGAAGHVGGLLIEEGTAARAHLAAFVQRLASGSACEEPTEDLFEGVVLLDDGETLHKAALALTGRAPTVAEKLALSTSGDLAQVVEEHLLTDASFYTRIQDLYNDVLLTDRVLGGFKLISHLAQADFPNRFYFRKYVAGKANYNNATYTCGDPGNGQPCCADVDPYKDEACDDAGLSKPLCTHHDNHAVQNLRRQGLALIAYVIQNDKPFTEILTADYAVVNPALARIFGVVDTPGGVSFADHCDLSDWKPVKLEMDNQQGVTEENAYPSSKIPHAGIFSTHTFLNRFSSTTTNLNRHRTSMVMKRFLDIDIEKLVAFTVGQGAGQVDNPTKDQLTCSVCHSVMDPIAGAFHKWTGLGRVRRSRAWHVCTDFQEASCAAAADCPVGWDCLDSVCVAPGYEPSLCVRPIGYQGEPMPPSADKAPLRWMTAKMAADPRFATATAKTMLTLLTGRDVLVAPTDPADSGYPAAIRAAIAQEKEVARVAALFVDNGYDFKTTVTEIVTGAWFRAMDGNVDGAQAAALLAGQVGGGRLRTPEVLALRIRDVMGFPWVTLGGRLDSFLATTMGYKTIYGGIDSDAITTRMRDPFSVASAVARRMANETGCLAVPQDFAWNNALDRRFFVLVDPEVDSLDAGGQPTNVGSVDDTITFLHQAILQEEAPPGSEAFEETYELLLAVWQGGLSRLDAGTEPTALPQRCQATKDLTNGKVFAESPFPNRDPVLEDPNYVIRTWMAVVSYLLSDARFLLN